MLSRWVNSGARSALHVKGACCSWGGSPACFQRARTQSWRCAAQALSSHAQLLLTICLACHGKFPAGFRLPEALQGPLQFKKFQAGFCLPEALQGHRMYTHIALAVPTCRVHMPARFMDHRWLPLAVGRKTRLAPHKVTPGASSRSPGHLGRLSPLHMVSGPCITVTC